MTRKKRRLRMLTISWTSPYLRMILRPAYSALICLSSVTTKMRGKSWSSASLNSSRFLSTNSSKAYSSRRLLDSPLSHKHLTIRILRQKLKNNSRCFNSFRNKWKTSGRLLLTNLMSMLKLCQHQCKPILPNRIVPHYSTNFAKYKLSTIMLT